MVAATLPGAARTYNRLYRGFASLKIEVLECSAYILQRAVLLNGAGPDYVLGR